MAHDTGNLQAQIDDLRVEIDQQRSALERLRRRGRRQNALAVGFGAAVLLFAGPISAGAQSEEDQKPFTAPFVVNGSDGGAVMIVDSDGTVVIRGSLEVTKGNAAVKLDVANGAGRVIVEGANAQTIAAIQPSGDGGGSFAAYDKNGPLDALVSVVSGGGLIKVGKGGDDNSVSLAASTQGLGLKVTQNGDKKIELGTQNNAGELTVYGSGSVPLVALQPSTDNGGEVDTYLPSGALATALSSRNNGGLAKVYLNGDRDTSVGMGANDGGMGVRVQRGGKPELELLEADQRGGVYVYGAQGAVVSSLATSDAGGGALTLFDASHKFVAGLSAQAGGADLALSQSDQGGTGVAIGASDDLLGLQLKRAGQNEIELTEHQDAGQIVVARSNGQAVAAIQASLAQGGEVNVRQNGDIVGVLTSERGGGLVLLNRDGDGQTQASLAASDLQFGLRIRKGSNVRASLEVLPSDASVLQIGTQTSKPQVQVTTTPKGGQLDVYDVNSTDPVAGLLTDGTGGLIKASKVGDTQTYAVVAAVDAGIGVKVRAGGAAKTFIGVADKGGDGVVYVYGADEKPVAGLKTYDGGKGVVSVYNAAGNPVSYLSESKAGEGGALTIADPSGNGVFSGGYSDADGADVCLDRKDHLWCMGVNLPLQITP